MSHLLLTKPEKPVWDGPVKDGISQSIINGFQCPYRAYLNLIMGLEDDLPDHPNLVWGDCYHVGLEHLIRGDSLMDAKRAAIAHLDKYHANPINEFNYNSYKSTIPNMLAYYDLTILPQGEWRTEVKFEYPWTDGVSSFLFRGKADGYNQEAGCLVEHKCKGFYGVNPDLIAEEIYYDLQCNLYMKVFEVEQVYYDLIGIPESIKYGAPYKARDKADEQYGIELIYGGAYKPNQFFPVKNNTHVWFSQRPYTLLAEDQDFYWKSTIIPKVKRIYEWYDYVTSPEFDPSNPDCYNEIFYIQPVRTFTQSNTENFKCDYHAFLTDQEPLSSLKQTHTVFQELANE